MENTTARELLGPPLTEAQLARAIESASSDALHWKREAALGTLPKVSEMHLDWDIDPDLIEAGIDACAMQRLSFAIAEAEFSKS